MSDIGSQIIEKAREMGATLAGIASVETLKKSPSNKMLQNVGTLIDGVYPLPNAEGFQGINWPEAVTSALVIALSHPEDRPELDWFDAKGGTPGNRTLVRINREMSEWIEKTFGIKTHKMKYQIEDNGIHLKDAAVLAGLGCLGRNNILITKEFGPRVRLRGMLLEAELTPTGPVSFDPCDGCEEYCRQACPQNAFEKRVHSSAEVGVADLPGRDGNYSRSRCMIQMMQDTVDSGAEITDESMSFVDTEEESKPDKLIKWCRLCEFSCPVGNQSQV